MGPIGGQPLGVSELGRSEAVAAPPPAPSATPAPGFAGGHKPVIWVRLRVDDQEVVAEPTNIDQAIKRIVKRVVKTGTVQRPPITISGPIPETKKQEIRAAYKREFNRDHHVIAAKARLREMQDEEEAILWLM